MYTDLGMDHPYFGVDDSRSKSSLYGNDVGGYLVSKFDNKEVTARSVDEYSDLDVDGPENSGILSSQDGSDSVSTDNDDSAVKEANGKSESIPDPSNSSLLTQRNAIVKYAKQFDGNPYVYGGTSLSKGTDCSGFTMGVYAHFGYSITRTTYSQYNKYKKSAITPISTTNLKRGDLIFYSSNSSLSNLDHVALYIGSGKIIHAGSSRTGIHQAAYDYRTPIAAVRIIN